MIIIFQHIYQHIKTPLFVVNSQYDSAVLESIYLLPCTPPDCSSKETALLREYKAEFNRQSVPLLSGSSENGYFLDSCYVHCQTVESNDPWTRITVNGQSIAQTFGDWYFERSIHRTVTRLRDCDSFPCNPSCPSGSGGEGVRNFTSPNLFVNTWHGLTDYYTLNNTIVPH